MGIIIIETSGSFGRDRRVFEAIHHGHADAVAQAIEYLSGDLLPKSTAQDHELHDSGCVPDKGFARKN